MHFSRALYPVRLNPGVQIPVLAFLQFGWGRSLSHFLISPEKEALSREENMSSQICFRFALCRHMIHS